MDNDGEFLLIEAAAHLPNWLQPDTAIHRVWLHGGALHIIPLATVPTLGDTHAVAIKRALEVITSGKEVTQVSNKVAEAVQKRIDLAAKLAPVNCAQWTACTLPVKLAYLLKQHPEWIAKAVTAFYHRDPINVRNVAQKFPKFGTGPKVNTMVRFTRCTYAQASSQHWLPPRAYGVASAQSLTTPLVQNIAFELGAKIACGFELLYHQEMDRQAKYSIGQALNAYPFNKDAQWKEYLLKLNSIGYFRGLSETHIKYTELEKKAKHKFLSTHPDKIKSVTPPGLCQRIDSILSEGFDPLSPDQRLALFPDSALFSSTSTEWMNISPEEVDKILLERQMEAEERRQAEKDQSDSTRDRTPDIFDSMVKDIEKFLVLQSDVDGVDLKTSKPKSSEGAATSSSQSTSAARSSIAMDSDSDNEDFYESDSDEDKVDLEDFEDDVLLEADPANASAERTMMLELMKEMDSELLQTELAKSFEKRKRAKTGEEGVEADQDEDDDSEDDLDVDMNINLVKNFIESYAAQNGVAGPVSTLLGQLEDWKQRQKETS